MKNFISVSTNAARYQDISLNPQKLAGMCAKLKCCLNYEVDSYVEASRKLPPKDAVLQTADGDFHQFKVDILAGLITYSSDKNLASNLETISIERAKAIIEMNRQGEKPLSLLEDGKAKPVAKPTDLLAEADLSRFDKAKKKKKKNNKNKGPRQQEGDNKPQKNENRAQNGDNKPQKNEGKPNNQRRDNRNQGNHPKGDNRQPRNDRRPNKGYKPQNGNKPQGGNKPQNGNNAPQNGNKPQGNNAPQGGNKPQGNNAPQE